MMTMTAFLGAIELGNYICGTGTWDLPFFQDT